VAELNARHNWLGTDAELRTLFLGLGFVTASAGMVPLLRRSWRAAQVSDAPLLIEGETGTGKQALADAIYHLDPKRGRNPFVTVHCGALQESLAESELFGHEKGAFSGAVSERKGLFQTAHRGTLFLDDVNDLPMSLQPKLLDVLQRGRVRAVGSDSETPLDVRVIAACNQPLEPLVREGKFRADLYYRLDVIRLALPPLRERREDITALLLRFAKRYEEFYGPVDSVDPDLVRHLCGQPFAGNVRELQHAVQRMLFAKTEGRSLTLEDWLRQAPKSQPSAEEDLAHAAARLWRAIDQNGASFDATLRDLERRLLESALAEGGTKRQIAIQLGMSERNLYHKLRAHGVHEPQSGADRKFSTTVNSRRSPGTLRQSA